MATLVTCGCALAADPAADWNKRGATLLDRGKLAEARECLLHSLGLLKPSDPRALAPLINLATVERLDRRFDESERLWLAGIETARRARISKQEMFALLYGYAAMLRDMKREPEARAVEAAALEGRFTVPAEALRPRK